MGVGALQADEAGGGQSSIMARASKAKRPKRAFDARADLCPGKDRAVPVLGSDASIPGGAASAAATISGMLSQGPPGRVVQT
jgi:hypothetical protein